MGLKVKALLRSPWVFHLSTGSCNNCDIEIIDCLTPRFDIERFGMQLAGSIRHADVLLITGSGNRKSMERVKKLYEQAPRPCFVVAIGECSLSRGMFIHSYNCPVPIDRVIPVDVYIPGCPPKPEAIIAGVAKLLEKVRNGGKAGPTPPAAGSSPRRESSGDSPENESAPPAGLSRRRESSGDSPENESGPPGGLVPPEGKFKG